MELLRQSNKKNRTGALLNYRIQANKSGTRSPLKPVINKQTNYKKERGRFIRVELSGKRVSFCLQEHENVSDFIKTRRLFHFPAQELAKSE